MSDKELGKKAPKPDSSEVVILDESQAAELNYGKGDGE